MFALLVLFSQKQDPSINESYNLIKIRKCVGIFCVCVRRVDELLCMIHLTSFFPWMWTIFLFFSLLFLTCLVGMWHTFFGYASFTHYFWHTLSSMWHTFFGYASFIYFCVAHVFDGYFEERGQGAWSFIFCGYVDGNILLSSSVEV